MLVQALEKYRGTHPLVLAIPRGAVPMGALIASSRYTRRCGTVLNSDSVE